MLYARLNRFTPLFLLIFLLNPFLMLSPVPVAYAVPSEADHCTDWPQASLYSPTSDKDLVVTDYNAYLNRALKSSIPGVPTASAGWQVLIRPNVPFAIFYTENITKNSADIIIDPISPSSTANFDEDTDLIPDFAERVLNCLQIANERYKSYFELSDGAEDNDLQYMYLEYKEPISGTLMSGKYYPVVIRMQGRQGLVSPVLSLGTWNSSAMGTSVRATLMEIDSKAQTFSGRNASPATPAKDWLYPGLESVIYHELAHTYQAIFTRITSVLDLFRWWVMEGTAVYMAEQALLPPCSSDNLNPPRIEPTLGFTTDCLMPNAFERYSENVLSDTRTKSAIFDQPWLGLTRDNAQGSSTSNRYSSVLFWYYAQRYLQDQAGDDYKDVVRALWKDHSGRPSVVREWAADFVIDNYSNRGFPYFYHRFMVDNYLQQVPLVGYDNPYYDSWNHWSGPNPNNHWYVGTSNRTTVTIGPADIVTATLRGCI